MYHFNSALYGNPQFGLGQSQTDQFRKLPVQAGAGQYKGFNTTGAVPVTLDYIWSGNQLAGFRAAWDRSNAFNFGANWFSADLPLYLDHSQGADVVRFPAIQDVDFTVAVTVGEAADQTVYGSRQYPHPEPIGDVSLGWIMGKRLAQAFMVPAAGRFQIRVDSDAAGVWETFPNNATAIRAYFPDDDETVDLNWSPENDRYQGAAPLSLARWVAGVGNQYLVILTLKAQPFQRYRCHATAGYEAKLLGYDTWRVSIPVEVDMSAPLGQYVWG